MFKPQNYKLNYQYYSDMIKVFGEEAKKIEEGQIFKARLDSVEGRDVIILEPVFTITKDGDIEYEVRYE
jgi:hypothetical protein